MIQLQSVLRRSDLSWYTLPKLIEQKKELKNDIALTKVQLASDHVENLTYTKYATKSSEIRPYPGVKRHLLGDFNCDGKLNIKDLDPLVEAIASKAEVKRFDLNRDGVLNQKDLDAWLKTAGEHNLGKGQTYKAGDANLDGKVDEKDFKSWNDSKFQSTAAWSRGDFNADGVVDGSDFNLWNLNKYA